MIILIFLILIIFSIVWTLIWIWFFRGENPSVNVIGLAKKAFKVGDYKAVKEILSEIQDTNMNNDSLYMLGISNLKLGKYDDAKTILEKILSSSPKDVKTLSNLAKVFELQHNYADAIATYNKALSENSKDAETYVSIANIHYEQEQYNESLEILEKANKIIPHNNKILCSIIRCKISLCDENTNEYQKLVQEYANFEGKKDLPLDYNITIAKIYAKNGEIDASFKHCLKASEIKEQEIDVYTLLGLIKLIKRDIKGAKESLTIALNLQPSNIEVHNIFSYLLCSQDNYCEKEQCRQKYYKLVEKYIK